MADFLIKCWAPFNKKLRLGVRGRSDTFRKLKEGIRPNDKVFWFHCASLGEYEQGLPVFAQLHKNYPHYKIVLSFFSPSGYEIRKHTQLADVVVYLPMDTKQNAYRFLELTHPELTIFVKYDIWPNYLLYLKKHHSKAILISALFRNNQSYFKWYGSLMLRALKSFEQIFVQNEASKTLLQSVGIDNAIVSGDTRYDRVTNQLMLDNSLPYIEVFKKDKLCMVIGSSWPEDDDILVKFINKFSSRDIKYIIAPHTIKPAQIENLRARLQPKSVLFSEKKQQTLADYDVFIVDTIGVLSKIYSYADIAYVGGAMGTTGLHNILEPAVFGVPVIIGPNYKKFPEAYEMIAKGGVTSISNYDELEATLLSLINDDSKRVSMGQQNGQFIKSHKGAVIQILDTIRI